MLYILTSRKISTPFPFQTIDKAKSLWFYR